MTFIATEPRRIKLPSTKIEGAITWRSPSNIALIKYWGKFAEQLPTNPSLSFTLNKSYTKTTVEYKFSKERKASLKFKFEGLRNGPFEQKLNAIIHDRLLPYLPWLEYTKLKITSENTFPHSAGIASSASAMSAFALCLMSIEKQVLKTSLPNDDFLKNASFIARLCSGSACRSIYPGYNLWGSVEAFVDSSDAHAIPVNNQVHKLYQTIHDAILIVGSEKKTVSSTKGHSLMKNHPFVSGRHQQSKDNLFRLLRALKEGEAASFFPVVENEALTLHALMMSSWPGYILLSPRSLQIIEKIYKFRATEKMDIGFTIDAGPNIHLLYFEKDKNRVQQFINKELLAHCENQKWIEDKIGPGPAKIKLNE